MRKYLMIGLALIFANVVPVARALDGCPNMNLNNGRGSPPVVVGRTVNAFVNLPPETDVSVYLDGELTYSQGNDGSTWSVAVFSLPLGSYGQHTLQDSTEFDCVVNFSNVPGNAPALSAPALSGSATSVRSNSPHTLSWTVPSGSTIDHYTISRGTPGNPEETYTLPARTTSQVLTSTAPAGTDRVIEFMVHACSSSDESSCGAWSNPIDIAVTAH
jgi:hypothetical protein